jgi:hypothetical protein
MKKVFFTFPLEQTHLIIEELEEQHEIEIMLGDNPRLARLLHRAAVMLRSQMRDVIRAGHYSEDEYDSTLASAKKLRGRTWVDAGKLGDTDE